MNLRMELQVIAHIESDFPDKFGIPRQSGLVNSLVSRIVFEPKFRNVDAIRGIEEFSHLWLLWHFSETDRKGEWSPTVRPPRLGGNKRVGVFATRSPFRPNPIGLSSVRLERACGWQVPRQSPHDVPRISNRTFYHLHPFQDRKGMSKDYLYFYPAVQSK